MTGNYATNFALIDRETNLVSNIIWGMIYDEEAFNNEIEFAVQIDDLNVSIGDSYDGEYFYHEGKQVLTIAEIMAVIQAELESVKTDLADVDAALNILVGEE